MKTDANRTTNCKAKWTWPVQKFIVISLILVFTFMLGQSPMVGAEASNEHEAAYNTFITLCGMYDIALKDSAHVKIEDGAKDSYSGEIADGAMFKAYYDADKLTGYELSLIGDSYAGEKIVELSMLFVMSVDRTKDLAATEDILNNLTATATEDEALPGLTRCSYSTDTYNFSLIAMMGDYVLSIKPI